MSASLQDTVQTSDLQVVRRAVAGLIAGGEIDVPMLPEVAGRVMAMTADAEVDAAALTDIIHHDPALASHVIRIANSPLFLPEMPIVSLRQAVTRLGIRQVAQIAFAASIEARAFNVPGYQDIVKQLWVEAVTCAAYAKEVATQIRTGVESAFLCGLVHRIGLPVAIQLVVDVVQIRGAALKRGETLDVVREYFLPVGVTVAERWELPETVQAVMRYANSWVDATQHRKQVLITAAARNLTAHHCNPEAMDADAVISHPVSAALGLSAADVRRLIGRAESVDQFVAAMSA